MGARYAKEKVTKKVGKKEMSVWEYYDHLEGPQPGTATFVPTKEWLSQKLRVPVKDCIVAEKKGMDH